MIPFNPVFTKYLLSAVLSCVTSTVSQNHFLQRRKDLSLQIFNEGSDAQQMPPFSLCPLFVCVWLWPRWGSLCILAERLDGSQFGGGASNEEEGRPGKDGCFFHLHYLRLWWLLSRLQTFCVFHQQRAQSAHGYLSLNLQT